MYHIDYNHSFPPYKYREHIALKWQNASLPPRDGMLTQNWPHRPIELY